VTEHKLDKLATRRGKYQTSYWCVCSCGRKGTRFVTEEAARRDHAHHIDRKGH